MRQHINWIANPERPYGLNLSGGFEPYNSVNLKFDRFIFRGGEQHLKIDISGVESDNASLVITQRYNSGNDIIDILLAVDAAKRVGFGEIHLVMPYFPAARQDRVCNEGEPLTVKVFTDMINGCGFKSVSILCPHSEVTPALLDNVVVFDELKYVDQVIQDIMAPLDGWQKVFKPDTIMKRINIACPDAGAGKRVNKIVNHFANKYPHIEFKLIRCEKVRNVKTGDIEEFFVGADDLKGYPTIVCDDINCMGGTFLGLAQVLRERNCGELILFTAHADDAEGIQNIITTYDHYYTTNSKKDWGDLQYTLDNKFTCLPFTV